MHPLAEYLEKKGLTQKDLALLSGITQSMVSQGLAGESRFGLDSARRIYEATGGEVPLKVILYWPDVPLPDLVERRLPKPPKPPRRPRAA